MAATKEIPSTQSYLAFSQRMSKDLNIVGIDHCYAKPWSSHPDASNARPIQMLFLEKSYRMPAVDKKREEDELIDVEGEDFSPPTVYDVSKARAMMLDCDRHASLLRPDFSEKEDWEDHFSSVRTTWTVQQNRIFAKVMKVLQADRLCRLSIVGNNNEPVLRRLQIDKAAKRVRYAFGNIGWDKNLILWLHNLLLEKLRGQLLTSYLEVLQKLKAKIPSLVDRLIEGTSSKQGTLASESLGGLLKRNWDPVISSLNTQRLKKLPDNPLLLLIPGAPLSLSNPTSNKRYKFWQNQLASMGKVINVVPVNNNLSMPIANCVENMVATTRSKILEMKGHFPGRLIVLLGWNIGSLVALHVSLVEVVHAVVCLGFPTMGINGNRGEVDDSIYNCKTPTLFVVGQHASATNLDCLEDLRERLRVETGLILLGGGDDQLRMMRSKKRSCGLTQCMVDRCIMDEMSEFLGNVLSQVMVLPENMEEVEVAKKQQKKRKQKDMSSAAGSQIVDGIVKQPKKIRAMKVTNLGPGSFSRHTLVTGTNAFGKKSPPRKKLGKKTTDGRDSDQKSYVHLTLPVITSSPADQVATTKPSISEAAAIASAPELSTLLQSIKTSTEQAMTSKSVGPLISSKISSSAATSLLSSTPSPIVPTTTALTLSKFLASSGLLTPTEDSLSAFEAKPMDEPLSEDIDSEDLPGKEDSPVKQPQTQQQQPQILFRTSSSSTPFSIPLSFSLASKMLKSGAIMKPIGVEAGSQQIQQLLTGTSGTSDRGTAPSSPNAPSSSDLPLPLNTSTTSAISSVASVTLGRDPCSALSATLTDSPRSSVINIGNDTVYLKENPPTTNSAPGTVSIDLGQIASGSSNSTMKLQSSKISLIPSVKHIPMPASSSSSSSSASSSSASSPERVQLSSPVSFSKTSVSALPHQTHPLPAVSKQQLNLAVSSPASTATNQSRLSKSTPTVFQSTPRFALSALSSSQLLSTLSSSTGVIRFKLASPQVSQSKSDIGSSDVKLSTQGKDETDGPSRELGKSSDPFAKSSRLPSFIDLTEDSPPDTKKVSKTVSAFAGNQTLSLLSMKTGVKSCTTNLIITPLSSLKQGTSQVVKLSTTNSSKSPLTSISLKSKSDTVAQTSAQTVPQVEPSGEVMSSLTSTPVTTSQSLEPVKDHDLSTETVPSTQTSSTLVMSSPSILSTSCVTSVSSPTVQPSGAKTTKSTISTYTATPKTVLSTVASTRTRRIKVPKQYDL